jgi:hypothetical protein
MDKVTKESIAEIGVLSRKEYELMPDLVDCLAVHWQAGFRSGSQK